MTTVNGVLMSRNPVVKNHDLIVYRINDVIQSSFTKGQNLMVTLEAHLDRFSALKYYIHLAGLRETLKKGNINIFLSEFKLIIIRLAYSLKALCSEIENASIRNM